MTGLLHTDWLKERLAHRRIGGRIEWTPECGSTNDLAWDALESGDADGLVVLTEYQVRGRGRLGRCWQMPRGAGLLMSVALESAGGDSASGRPPHDESVGSLTGGTLCMLAALAACVGVQSVTGVTVTIKWPNDLLIRGRKVGGILIESRDLASGRRGFVVGMGINCLQQEGHWEGRLRERATSLELESSQAISREAVLVSILEAFDDWLSTLQNRSPDDLRDAWRTRCGDIGGRITLLQNGKTYSGTMLDVDPSAAIILQLDRGGIRSFDVGDTSVYQGIS